MASPQKDRMLEEMKLLREKWSNRPVVVVQDENLVVEGQQINPMDEEILSINANNNGNTPGSSQHQAPAINGPKSNPLKNVLLGVEINNKQSWICFAPKTPFVATQTGQFFSSENADDWQFVNTDLTPEDQSKVVERINQTLRASYQEMAGKYNVQEIMGPNGQLTFQFTHRDGSALKPAEERQLSQDIEQKMPDVFNRHAASKDDNIKLRMMAAPESREVKSAIRHPAPRPGAPGYKSAKELEEESRRFACR